MKSKRLLCFLLAALVLLCAMPVITASAEPDPVQTQEEPGDVGSRSGEDAAAADNDAAGLKLSGLGYFDYLAEHADASKDVEDVVVPVLEYQAAEGIETQTLADDDGVSHEGVVLVAGKTVTWSITVPKSGFYQIKTLYLPIKAKPINAEIRLYIDGITPFTEATSITLSRVWTDVYPEGVELNEYGHRFDSTGNELSPESVEVLRWNDYVLHDNDYMTDEDFFFYFEEGTHTLALESQRESICFAGLTLARDTEPGSYSAYLAEHKGASVYEGDVLRIEAENASEHSERSLSMAAEYSSPHTSPAHYSQIRLNTIGGENWKKVGQWIAWEVDAPQDGLYTLSFKYIQNFVRGFRVYRTITVDGAVPFKEFTSVAFNPNNDWQNFMVADAEGQPYYVYLTKGKHQVALMASLGPLVTSLQELEDCINELNADYLKIIAVTGTSPDSLRDYNLDLEIPDLIDSFKVVNDRLKAIDKELETINGGVSGGMSAFISVMTKQLDKFIKQPLDITTGLSAYKSNISSLSDMLTNMTNQSLLLDTVYVGGKDQDSLPGTHVNIWESFKFGVLAFVHSFYTDYNAYGNDYSQGDVEYKYDPITIWMSSGRDQFNVLKSIIDDKFAPEYGIPVNINLVTMGNTLTQAILAGVGPDACLYVDRGLPVHYSMRGSLEDMNQFNAENQIDANGEKKYKYTFKEVQSWFKEDAFIATEYFDGKNYGLPETQTFPMMFYRTDVLARLGAQPPESWDDLRDMLTIIQRQNMNVGMNAVGFTTYLYQNGGSYYNEDKSKTNFVNQTAVDAFTLYNSFYTDYAVPITYDALNRFRSGEYPIIIADYSFYNNLSVGAPEIKGLWAMTKIPGTRREDGTVNHTEVCGGTVCVMIKGCENKEQVWDFMSWWVSAETQADYGNKIEARLGAGGRYTTANREAFEMLPWSYNDAQAIKEQWNHITDFPRLPGDYYVTRMLNNAHRAVLYKGENPRAALVRYSKEMDKEIARKRIQYHVDEIVGNRDTQ